MQMSSLKCLRLSWRKAARQSEMIARILGSVRKPEAVHAKYAGLDFA
jgi:hypothetical protein